MWQVCAADFDSQLQPATGQACTWTGKNCMKLKQSPQDIKLWWCPSRGEILIEGKTWKRALRGTYMHVDYLRGKCVQRLNLLVLPKLPGVTPGDLPRGYRDMIRTSLEFVILRILCQVWHAHFIDQGETAVHSASRPSSHTPRPVVGQGLGSVWRGSALPREQQYR